MRAVVTGATGHVGNNLVRLLVERGWSVRAGVHRGDEALEGVDCERVPVDLDDEASLDAAFTGAEVVFHLAAVISIDGDRDGRVARTNVDGAARAARAAGRAGARRMVHMSSIHAFDPEPAGEPVDEGRRRGLDSKKAYDRSKARGEAAVRRVADEAGMEVVVVNPTAVIGPYDFGPSRAGQVLLDLARRRLPSLIDGGFHWVDVRDVAASTAAAAERGVAGESYLLPGNWVSVVEMAEVASAVTGVPRPRMVTPRWLAQGAAPFSVAWARLRRRSPLFTGESVHALGTYRHISGARAGAALGHAPRPFEETVRDTYAWFIERGLLPGRGA